MEALDIFKTMCLYEKSITEGRKARLKGKKIEDCPYSEPSTEKLGWISGWSEKLEGIAIG